MAEEVEISSLDLRYEGFRMRSPGAERALFMSIMEKGIRDPLRGVDTKEARILLDGFKRLRCARRLGIGTAPYASIGSDEVLGIIELIRVSNAKSLSILEQARFVDELKNVHKMSTTEIAALLERSKAWVSVRSGIIHEMSDDVLDEIFKGRFPVYAYMYTLRPFIRINGINSKEIDTFVHSVAGKNLSIRDIEILAHGYFKGPDEFREQIKNGNISWGLNRLKETSANTTDCTEIERGMLRDLEITLKYMQRVTYKSRDKRYKSNAFFAQANLLAGGILSKVGIFSKALKDFHDRSGKT
jgi:hypothetical protein